MQRKPWANSDRRSRLPANWARIRVEVLDRDRRQCQWIHFLEGGVRKICGVPANEVHHIRNNDDHSLSNLRALCADHHAQKTQKESWAARHANRRKINERFRRTEEHPALAFAKGDTKWHPPPGGAIAVT